MCRSVQAARYVTRTEGGGLKSVTWNFVAEQATGIGLALSAWELACHTCSDHELAGQCRFLRCPLLPVRCPFSPPDRHAAGMTPQRELPPRSCTTVRLQGRLTCSGQLLLSW